MASRWRLAGELATVGVLAAATTVALTGTGGDASRGPVAALRGAEVSSAPVAAVGAAETLPMPPLPVLRSATAASSGRSVRHSAWRAGLREPAVRGVADIPARALEAYQRAATVIDHADRTCHLEWPLLAAIAKVESDHGRFSGSAIRRDGRVHPLILGPRLTGSDHTRRMRDTDAGRLDGDRRVDRALGPFQIVPATWSQVRVDADGDGRRDPHDLDDAALAASVFLCAGRGDLGTSTGQRLAVFRFNPDGGYARLVLAVMSDYEEAAATELVVLVRTGVGRDPVAPMAPTAHPTTTSSTDDASFVDAGSPGWTGTTVSGTPSAPTPTPTAVPTTTPTTEPSPSASASTTPTDAPTTSAPPTGSASPTASTSTTASPSPTDGRDPVLPPEGCAGSSAGRGGQYGEVRATASARFRSNGSACM